MLDYLEEDLEMVYNNTADCWEAIRHKTLFITGGTGFFGIWLIMTYIYINRKLNLNSGAILLTRNKAKFLSKNPWLAAYDEVTFLEGDLLDFDFIDEPIDYIIHAATEASVELNIKQPLVMFDTIVNGTKRVLEFAKLKEVKSFLLTSSGAVYGQQPPDVENIKEDYIGAPVSSDPTSMYGEGKRMAELLCSVYHKHYNLPVKIARCYAFIGPFLPLDSHFAAGNFIKNLINEEDIIIDGDGSPHRSYMYAADLTVWLWTILLKGENNLPYNVGSEESITISELAKKIAANQTKVIIRKPLSGNFAQRYVPDTSRAADGLKLKTYTK
ncbi:MAG: NAD(P)-dependent oxidoreductase, partial [Flavobacterium sp.]